MDGLARFLARHALSDFRHRGVLLPALHSGEAAPIATPELHVPVDDLQVSYIARRAPLDGLDGAFARSLRADLDVLLPLLARHRGHTAELAGFLLPPGFTFTVFTCRDDGAMLGCVLGIERALTDEDTFARVFGGAVR